MERCIATILLMLSLEALVVAGRLSAAVADDVGIIRLPSEGKGLADQVTAALKKADEERPWKCCDLAMCTMSFPPTCRCLDRVEQCASACKLCEAVESDPSRYTCQDWYHGDPGPRCTEEGNEDVVVVRGAAGGAAGEVIMAAATKARDHDEERPWKCCDLAICTKSFPPICRCLDMVEQCASACKECEAAESDPSRYRCLDRYIGDPGPRCTEEGNEDVVVVRGAAGGAAGEVIMAAATKARDHDEERPWKCCDVALCTRSFPPICQCMDIVEQYCASACKECEQVSWNPDRYRCLDRYIGDPGPSCAKHVGGQKQGRRRVRGGN